MTRFAAALATTLIVCLIAPLTASAAEISWDGTKVLTYKATSGEANRITVTQAGNIWTIVDNGALQIVISGAKSSVCVNALGLTTCTLPANAELRIQAGDLDDTVSVTAENLTKLQGEGGNDLLTGGAGPDRLDGGSGDDTLVGGRSADELKGAGGLDTADYSSAPAGVVVAAGVDKWDDDTQTPDTDGVPGEGDVVEGDVENLLGSPYADVLVARKEGGALSGGAGDDRLVGRDGPDTFAGGDGDDVIEAADKRAETVSCGAGTDVAQADTLDALDADCNDPGAPEPTAPGEAEVIDPTGGDDVPSEPTTDARPEAGESVVAEPAQGRIRIKLPGKDHFALLEAGDEIPLGSEVDARHGAVTLFAAAGANRLDGARFTGAVFRVTQTRGRKPITELRLRGGSFAACGKAVASTSARKKKRAVRGLWGSGHGRFRTRGRNSAATVRGTIWLVEDRCDGTLTRVRRGVVAVRDFAHKKTVRVAAGERYFARGRAR
jgi:Ca2+-binding RTX toxin-like protein